MVSCGREGENGAHFKLKYVDDPFGNEVAHFTEVFCGKCGLGAFVDTLEYVKLHIQATLDVPVFLFGKLVMPYF